MFVGRHSGLVLYTRSEDESFKYVHKQSLEDFIKGFDKHGPDYEQKLEIGHTIAFLDTTEDDKKPIEVLGVFVHEGDKHNYEATLYVYGYIAVIKLVYSDGKVKYIYNDREPWPQSFDEGIENCGDLLFCAKEEGYTKEDILNYIKAWIGSVDNYEDLMEIAGPERLNKTLLENLSDVELDVIEAALNCSNFKYKIGDDWFTMIEDCTMSEED